MWPMLRSLLNKRFFTLRVWSLIKVIDLKGFIWRTKEDSRKMEHIIKRHMIPVPKKKSYFLSRDVTYVTKLVKQTIFHPTRLVTQFALKWLKLNWLIELVELWFSDWKVYIRKKARQGRWSTLLDGTWYPLLKRKVIFCHEMWHMLLSLLNKLFFTLRVGSLIKVIELKWFI